MRLALAVACWALAQVVGVGIVAAHAVLLDSTPRAGEVVTAAPRLVLHFNSRIVKELSTVRLIGGPLNTKILLLKSESGAGPDALIFTLPPLVPGSYRAEWKVLSVDGHVTNGLVAFTIVAPAAPGR